MLLTEFDEKKFAKSMWKEGHESGYTEGHDSGYTEGRESILEILDAINRGNDTVEKLTALGYDAKRHKRYWRRNKPKQQRLCSA